MPVKLALKRCRLADLDELWSKKVASLERQTDLLSEWVVKYS